MEPNEWTNSSHFRETFKVGCQTFLKIIGGGVITEAHFTNLTSLKELYISSNSLPPSLPLVANVDTEWIPPFSLQYLKFRSCRFGPKFPMWIRHLTELQTLTFRRAKTSDTLPDWLWEMNSELEEFGFWL